MILFDTFTIDGVRRTADGYLAAFARVARTGIQEYRGSELGRPDLDRVRVYRPASEVFHADALRSFAHRPVTLKHPTEPVTARNWKRHAGGQTGDEVVRDGEFVRVPMVMMDQALIDAYEKNGIKELSMGYSTDIQWRSGITDAGEPYDAVQTEIRGNHLAVVPVARGGDQLRIGDEDIEDDKDKLGHGSFPHSFKTSKEGAKRLKAGSAVMHEGRIRTVSHVEEEGKDLHHVHLIEDDISTTNDGDTNMTKLVLDGLTVTVADDQSGAIIEKHIKVLNDQLKSIGDDFEDFKKKKKEGDKEVEDAKKLVDAKDGEIAVLKKQVADAAVTPEKLDVMVKDRLAVIDKAKALVGDKYVFDGKTIDQIRKDSVLAKLGDAAATMNEGAIEGAFTALTADAKAKTSDSQIGDALRHRPHSASTQLDARDAAFADLEKRLQNGWKTPVAN